MKQFALQIVSRLREAGFIALWAGGCVRDMLLGSTPHDYDVATDATPSQVRKLFRRTLAVGAQFGVIEVLGDEPGLHVQVATFRSDGSYSDGRHPDSVKYGTPQDDAVRRDFTINGLFYDPLKEEVIDYVGGQADLKLRIVKAIGDPVQRIEEDKLRMLRGVRFASRLGFTLEKATAEAIVAMRAEIKQVSAERITDELKKMLTHPTRSKATRMLIQSGLLHELMPEFELNWGEFDSSKLMVYHLPDDASFPLVWTSLLIDIKDEERPKQLMTQDELRENFGHRFRLSLAEIAHVQYLYQSYSIVLFAEKQPWATLKPILAHQHRDDLLALVEAFSRQQGRKTIPGLDYCRDRLKVWSMEQLHPPVLVTGQDVAQLGIKPGPRFKELLDAVRTEQLNETITDREQALELLKRLAATT